MDVATGTGDFAIQACRVLNPKELIGTDISEGMMNVGRQKVKEAGLESRISFAKEDCTALSFPNNRFDAITVAFGVRNFEDLDKGLKEMHRVLSDNGKLVILELSEPEWLVKAGRGRYPNKDCNIAVCPFCIVKMMTLRVICIVALLKRGLGLPSLGYRRKFRLCRSNLRQCGLSPHPYEESEVRI